MNTFKLSAVALALAASFSASAMTSIQDEDLAQVSGQEGVSIISDLNVNIGSFTYIDDGASVSLNNIDVKGLQIVMIDLLTGAGFDTTMTNSVLTQSGIAPADATAVAAAIGAVTGFTGQDVVQIAYPQLGAVGSVESINARKSKVSISVASITTGNGGASLGGLQINKIDQQGTKIWLYGHQ